MSLVGRHEIYARSLGWLGLGWDKVTWIFELKIESRYPGRHCEGTNGQDWVDKGEREGLIYLSGQFNTTLMIGRDGRYVNNGDGDE